MWSWWSPDCDPVVYFTAYPTDGLHGGCSPKHLTDNTSLTETLRLFNSSQNVRGVLRWNA